MTVRVLALLFSWPTSSIGSLTHTQSSEPGCGGGGPVGSGGAGSGSGSGVGVRLFGDFFLLGEPVMMNQTELISQFLPAKTILTILLVKSLLDEDWWQFQSVWWWWVCIHVIQSLHMHSTLPNLLHCKFHNYLLHGFNLKVKIVFFWQKHSISV